MERSSRGSAKVKKSDAEKYLAAVPEQYVFWIHGGSTLKDLKELQAALAAITDEVYSYHANESRNDFATWVRDIIGDEKLAQDLEKTTGRNEAEDRVKRRVNSLVKKASGR